MKTKAELLKITQVELLEFLKKAKERDPGLEVPNFKTYPEVIDITIEMHGIEKVEEDKFSVYVTLMQKKKKSDRHVEKSYFGACYRHFEEDHEILECAFINCSEQMSLFLQHFVKYHVYEVLSREGIPLRKWNQWDGEKKL